MQQGYGKRKTPLQLPTISKRQQRLKYLLQSQKTLIKQVQVIDKIIKTDNLIQINHLLFTSDVKNRLIDDLVGCLKKQYRLLSYGFQFWKKNHQCMQFVKGQLIEMKPSFKEMLHDSSIRAIEQYQAAKIDVLKRKTPFFQNDRARIRSYKQSRTVNKQANNFSQYVTISNNVKHSQDVSKKMSAILSLQQQKYPHKLYTEKAQTKEKDQINLEQIQKFIEKHRNNLISIWLPPQTYPQFFGIVIVKIIKTSKIIYGRIKKYILFRESVNKRLFQSILQFIVVQHQVQLTHLQMLMSRNNYKKYFQPSGWKMKSWEGVDKINAIFDYAQL